MDKETHSRLDTIESLLLQHLQVDKKSMEAAKHWHLKKEVTVAHILSTIGIVGIALASWFSLSSAVAALDTRTENITESRIAVVESELHSSAEYMRENFRSINGSLEVINSKLDILEERSVENRREN